MGQSHLENAESTAFTGNQMPQLQESGLGTLSLQDVRNLDTKTNTANLPEVSLNDALANVKGPINDPESNRRALREGQEQNVWAPEEALSLGSQSQPIDSTINSPEDNRNANDGQEKDVWAPEEELSLGRQAKDASERRGINSPRDNRNAIQGHEHDVWAPEEELSLGRQSKGDGRSINSPGENRNAIQGHEHDVWAPEEKLSLHQKVRTLSKEN